MKKPTKIDFAVRIFFCAFVCCMFILPTLYVTVLYKYTPVETVDYLLKDVSFLPMNISSQEDSVSVVTTSVTVTTQFTTQSTTQPTTETTTQPVTETTTETTTTTEPTTISDDMVEVPDFSEYTYNQLKKNKKLNKNFKLMYEFAYSDTVPENEVIGQRAAVGEKIKKGSQVNIIISRGVEKILLRDVVGMDYNTARELLVFAGFSVKEKVIENDGTQTPDQVYSMSKEPNEKYDRGTEIVLTIWGD